MPIFAILMQGTVREARFLTQLLPHIVGAHQFDLYLCLRQTARDAVTTRTSHPETPFSYEDLVAISGDHVFLSVLPAYDPEFILKHYVLPVGPTNVRFEVQMIVMFLGIFAGVEQIKRSGRHYDFVVRMRTDYLCWDAPFLDSCLSIQQETGGKIIVDAQRTCAFRYQDNVHLPWQGSVSDLFSFCSFDRFLQLWDFGQRLQSIWTGVPETTLFRNALLALVGETVQHPRKNEAVLREFFWVIPGDFKESPYYFRQHVLSSRVKEGLLQAIVQAKASPKQNLSLVWSAYRAFHAPGQATRERFDEAMEPFAGADVEIIVDELTRQAR